MGIWIEVMEIEVKVDTTGLDALIKRLEGSDGELAKVAEAMAEAIHKSADQRVPKDTGALKKSGRTESRRDGSAAVIYGDSKAPYALAVHEDPSVQPTSGEKKFLRNAAMESRKLLRVAASRLSKTISK